MHGIDPFGEGESVSLHNCINCVHCDDHFFIFISFLQFIYDLFPGLEIKKILRSLFGDQLEKYSRQMQIFSRQFV